MQKCPYRGAQQEWRALFALDNILASSSVVSNIIPFFLYVRPALSFYNIMADTPMPFLGAASFLIILFYTPPTPQDEAHHSWGALCLDTFDGLLRLCCPDRLQHNFDNYFDNYLPKYGTVLRPYRSHRAISWP